MVKDLENLEACRLIEILENMDSYCTCDGGLWKCKACKAFDVIFNVEEYLRKQIKELDEK